MERHHLAIVIPAYNESNNISLVISNCKKYGHVIVVDDGSSDSTLEIASSNANKVIRHKINRGYDAALTSGLNYASNKKYKYVITFDADGQHDHNQIPMFIKKLDSGFDLVIGKRSKMPRVSEYIFSLFTKFLTNVPDPLCGFKAYKNLALKKILSTSDIIYMGTSPIFSSLSLNLSITYIDVNISERNGHSKMGNKILANIRILKALFQSILFYIRKIY